MLQQATVESGCGKQAYKSDEKIEKIPVKDKTKTTPRSSLLDLVWVVLADHS